MLLVLFDDSKKTIQTNFAENRFRIWVDGHPRKQRFSHDVVFGNKSQKTRIRRLIAIITHHEIIILFEGITGDLLAIDTDFSFD